MHLAFLQKQQVYNNVNHLKIKEKIEMKKLSVLLAFVLVISCVLAAGAAETVNARYIKFVITVLSIGNSFVWMNEVEVFAPAA